MFGLGTPELLLILVVLVVLFGASRLPQLGKSLGETVRGVRKGLRSMDPDEEPPAAKDVRPK